MAGECVIRLRPDKHKRIKLLSVETGMTMTDLLDRVVEAGIARIKSEEKQAA